MASLRFRRTNFVGALVCGLLVVLFCLILLYRDPLVFWNDDYQISILPVFADVARSWGEGNWPILSPYSWVCANLAGEYQYGTFSLFVNAAVVAIWKIFSGFAHQASALSIAHLVVLGLGGFVLARGRALSVALATMVGLIAALNGWIICWGASDWFGALGAFAWMPWAWWACEKALGVNSSVALASSQWSTENHRQDADATSSPWRFLWPVPFVYLVATGGFPYTVLMLGLLIAWLTVKSLVQTKSFRPALPMLCGVGLGFGLAAPALLALFAYVHGSARETQPASAHWQWIVPPGALPGLIIPSWTVNWADFSTRYVSHAGTELACGLVAPAAVLCGLLFRFRDIVRRLQWELALLVIVLMIAMFPTTGLFRWSFRWLPFLHLILGLCAAECLAAFGPQPDENRNKFSPAFVAIALTGLTALAMKLFGTSGTYFLPLTGIFLAIAAFWTVAEHFLPAQSRVGAWIPTIVTFTSLLATYWCIPPNCGVPRFNFTESLVNPAPLDPARLYLSVYPPPELEYRMEVWPQPIGQTVRPGSTSMWAKLRFVNGYSPIRPSGVAKQFFFSIHGEIDSGMARLFLMKEAGPDGLLSEMGVDGIVLANEMDFNPEPANEWQLVARTAEGRVFHRAGQPLPQVRALPLIKSRPNDHFAGANVSRILDSRNRIEADVDVPEGAGPALIAFSRPYFEGYTASLGGRKLTVTSEQGLFPVLELPGGSHGRLILSYRPGWLVYGGVLATACGITWLAGLVVAWRSR